MYITWSVFITLMIFDDINLLLYNKCFDQSNSKDDLNITSSTLKDTTQKLVIQYKWKTKASYGITNTKCTMCSM